MAQNKKQMSDKCQNKDAMHIDWVEGVVYSAPCIEEATHIIVNGDGFKNLCDECARQKIEQVNYPKDLLGD
jgi:hypothetical protein